MFSKDNVGPMPPPVMLLSDGGHVENLALLPLLKKKLKKIIVVDGGYKNDEKLYGESLLNALMLARKKLNCSFLSEEGGDVISDLLEKFVNPAETEQKPRFYRFVVLVLFRLVLMWLITNEEKLYLWSKVTSNVFFVIFKNVVFLRTFRSPVCCSYTILVMSKNVENQTIWKETGANLMTT